jgi:hypothetical protein
MKQRLKKYYLIAGKKRPLLYISCVCLLTVLFTAMYVKSSRFQSVSVKDTPLTTSAEKKLPVSNPDTSPSTTSVEEATQTETPKPSVASAPAAASQTPTASSPSHTTQPQTATGVSYANINHYQYCDGTGNGTVEYITSVTFGLNGMASQPTDLTYVLETQTGTHSEITYPLTASIPSGGYSATAVSYMPGPNALILFTFYDFDKPEGIRVRVTAPYNYTSAWQPFHKICG